MKQVRDFEKVEAYRLRSLIAIRHAEGNFVREVRINHSKDDKR